MNDMLETIYAFYQIDSSTIWLLTLMCGAAAYKLRDKVANPATVWLLLPLFVIVAMTTYALAAQLHLFSPKRTVEWLTYTAFSASIGAIMGILFVAICRLVQDKFVTAAHIRATLRRDAEQEERGYPPVQV